MRAILTGSLLISLFLVVAVVYHYKYHEEVQGLLQAPIPNVLIDTSKVPAPESQIIRSPFMSTGIRVAKDNQEIRENKIYDIVSDRLPYLKSRSNRYAVELRPYKQGYYSYPYMGGRIDNVRIIGNMIRSTSQIQGVYSSDGSFTNLEIKDNIFNLFSSHQITISGMLSGNISGNKNRFGQPAEIILNPLSIGGNFFTGGLWILGFSESDTGYAPADTIVTDGSRYKDLRTAKIHPYDTNLIDFRYNEYFKYIETTPLGTLRSQDSWLKQYNSWMTTLQSKIGQDGVTEERINKIKDAESRNIGTLIYQISNQDLKKFALQQAARLHGKSI